MEAPREAKRLIEIAIDQVMEHLDLPEQTAIAVKQEALRDALARWRELVNLNEEN